MSQWPGKARTQGVPHPSCPTAPLVCTRETREGSRQEGSDKDLGGRAQADVGLVKCSEIAGVWNGSTSYSPPAHGLAYNLAQG